MNTPDIGRYSMIRQKLDLKRRDVAARINKHAHPITAR
jgi:hypothetical protein